MKKRMQKVYMGQFVPFSSFWSFLGRGEKVKIDGSSMKEAVKVLTDSGEKQLNCDRIRLEVLYCSCTNVVCPT